MQLGRDQYGHHLAVQRRSCVLAIAKLSTADTSAPRTIITMVGCRPPNATTSTATSQTTNGSHTALTMTRKSMFIELPSKKVVFCWFSAVQFLTATFLGCSNDQPKALPKWNVFAAVVMDHAVDDFGMDSHKWWRLSRSSLKLTIPLGPTCGGLLTHFLDSPGFSSP